MHQIKLKQLKESQNANAQFSTHLLIYDFLRHWKKKWLAINFGPNTYGIDFQFYPNILYLISDSLFQLKYNQTWLPSGQNFILNDDAFRVTCNRIICSEKIP